MNAHDAMRAIQDLLDGVEWNGAETLADIATILRDAGYRVRDLDDNDCPYTVDDDERIRTVA